MARARTAAGATSTLSELRPIEDELVAIVGVTHVDRGPAVREEDTHDEALGGLIGHPRAVVRPASTSEVAAVVAAAAARRVPLTPRGSGTGMSGACVPVDGGIVVSFERMNHIVEIDLDNHVAVVEPGVTLAELDAALAPHGLVYPVFPGEQSASLGGNVATNAGGMRAVKYGVTRHHVLGVEAVLGTGEVISAGGKFVKSTSGYDLTQLVIGSEGTLALVTRAILRLHPRPEHQMTLLAPFATLAEITASVPPIVASGLDPLMVEYLDQVTMASVTANASVELGIPEDVAARALAYLVVVVESHRSDRLEEDAQALAELIEHLGALDVYVLPSQAGTRMIQARERAFWAAKAAGADDIVDVVVPRASLPAFLDAVGAQAAAASALVVGCGHAADGNVHLSVWQADAEVRHRLLHDIIATGCAMGGAVSGEHGIGIQKRPYFIELEDPVKLALMRRIKEAFDPEGILNPGTIFDPATDAEASADERWVSR
ncbi:MAG: FAD-binding oxidoreductase [Acidimicrobiales bacterium]